jgi:hypothetical protein
VDLSASTIRQPLADHQVPGQFPPSNSFIVPHGHSVYPVAPVSCAPGALYPNPPQQFSQQATLQQNPNMLHQIGAYNMHSEEHVATGPPGLNSDQYQVSARFQVRIVSVCVRLE